MDKIALDTNVAIDMLNGKTDIISIVSQYDSIFIPVIVTGELLFGAKNSGKSELNLRKYRNFITSLIELPINNIVAEEYSSIRLNLKKKGRPIPENDIWIAAICLVNRVGLITRDKHFENIDGLLLEKI